MTDITELTQEAARESGSILIIVAARMARREFFTPLHALCEAGKRVVSTRALHDAVERAEERMVSQVQKIVDGHDRLTKKLKEVESRNAELVEALEKAQETIAFQQGEIKALLSSLESRTVKLPDALLPATHKSGELFMTPDNVEQGGYLNRDDVLRVLRAAGIKVEAE
ncbi:TPA: hypothetical protein ACF23B_003725 [Klebsiella quasipneumoniae subsp. similipneumoniae]